jgi:hypothetical protein
MPKISESIKNWEKYGLNQETEIRNLSFGDLIISRGNYNTGIIATYRDICEGKISRTPGVPIQVCWIREENKFLVTDGYHRLVERVLKKEKLFLCEIEWTGYTLQWSIPIKEERLLETKEIFKLTEEKIKSLIKEGRKKRS